MPRNGLLLAVNNVWLIGPLLLIWKGEATCHLSRFYDIHHNGNVAIGRAGNRLRYLLHFLAGYPLHFLPGILAGYLAFGKNSWLPCLWKAAMVS